MKIFVNAIRLGLIITGVLTFSATAAQDTEALAKAAQNPLADLIRYRIRRAVHWTGWDTRVRVA